VADVKRRTENEEPQKARVISRNKNWPFVDESKVIGMPLPKYLDWATGTGEERRTPRLMQALDVGLLTEQV
jgi:hypothetical protein